jgi:hypothetical protein
MGKKKSGKSEQKTNFWGNKYTQYYDKDGKKSGRSEQKENFWGQKYNQHYDKNNNKTGWNERKEDFWGNKYTQRYDNNNKKSGWNEKKQDFWGNNYTQYYDENNKKTYQREKKENFWGNKYDQFYDGREEGNSSQKDHSNKSPSYSSPGTGHHSNTSSGIGGLIAVAVVIGIIALCGSAILSGLKNSSQSSSAYSQNPTGRMPKGARVITTRANLRPQPSDKNRPLREVNYNENLQLLSTNYSGRGWYHVRHVSSGVEGWIHGNTIEFTY